MSAYRQGSYGIALKNNVHIVSLGTVRVIPNASDSYAIFRCAVSHDITFTGGVYEGDRLVHTGTTGQWGHLLSFLGCSNVTIRKATFVNAWGDGIYLGAAGDYTTNTSFVISDNVIDGARRNGISVTTGDGILIKNNVIKNTGPGTTPHTGTATLSDGPYYGIDFEPNNTHETIHNSTIDSNEFFGNEGGGMQLGIPGAIAGATPFTNILVTNNNVHDNSSIGQGAIYISRATGITAKKNTVVRNKLYGIFIVAQSNGNLFEGNVVTDNNPTNIGNAANKAGIWVYQSSNNTFNGNTVKNNKQFGFFFSASNDNTGTGNLMSGNPGGDVSVYSGTGNSIH